MKIYTVFCDYFATGEGVTISIAVAYNRQRAIEIFTHMFGSYYLSGAEIIESNTIPEKARTYMPQYVINKFEDSLGPTAFKTWCGQFHVNYS